MEAHNKYAIATMEELIEVFTELPKHLKEHRYISAGSETIQLIEALGVDTYFYSETKSPDAATIFQAIEYSGKDLSNFALTLLKKTESRYIDLSADCFDDILSRGFIGSILFDDYNVLQTCFNSNTVINYHAGEYFLPNFYYGPDEYSSYCLDPILRKCIENKHIPGILYSRMGQNDTFHVVSLIDETFKDYRMIYEEELHDITINLKEREYLLIEDERAETITLLIDTGCLIQVYHFEYSPEVNDPTITKVEYGEEYTNKTIDFVANEGVLNIIQMELYGNNNITLHTPKQVSTIEDNKPNRNLKLNP